MSGSRYRILASTALALILATPIASAVAQEAGELVGGADGGGRSGCGAFTGSCGRAERGRSRCEVRDGFYGAGQARRRQRTARGAGSSCRREGCRGNRPVGCRLHPCEGRCIDRRERCARCDCNRCRAPSRAGRAERPCGYRDRRCGPRSRSGQSDRRRAACAAARSDGLARSRRPRGGGKDSRPVRRQDRKTADKIFASQEGAQRGRGVLSEAAISLRCGSTKASRTRAPRRRSRA